MTEGERQSGLVIEVPEAEALVGRYRLELDANAALGAPAHVTILFPFVPAARVGDAVLDRLRRLFSACAPFDYRFARLAWFGEHVLWLAPDDPVPFRELTARVEGEWPEHPPFEGAFSDVVPHLTVGHGVELERLLAAERAVTPGLPVIGRATGVTLLVQDDQGRWSRRAQFPLAGATGG